MPYEFHEYASIFPLLEGKELDDLMEDIKANGQHELIVLYDDKILDGRNRYIACKKLNIAPRLRDFTCMDGDPLSYVWSANFSRRHLNTSQRSIAMAKRANFLEHGDVKAQQNGAIGQMAHRPISVREAAKIAGVSDRTMKRAKIMVKHGDPKDIEKIERGEMRLSGMAEVVNLTIPKSETMVPKEAIIRFGGPQVNIPEGFTAENYIRKGLKLEEEGVEPASVCRQLKIADNSYRKMREIVMIADREDLSPADRKLANQALYTMNTDKRLHGHDLIVPIINRVWGSNGKSRKNKVTSQNRYDEFEKKIDIISHVCASDVEIPQISQSDLGSTILKLEGAVLSLRGLIRKVKETYNV